MAETIDKAVSLQEKIEEIFGELTRDKKLQNEVDKYLFEKNRIPRGTLNELLVNSDKLDTLQVPEKVAIVIALSVVLGKEKIATSEYFSEAQIKKAERYKRKSESEKLELPVLLPRRVLRYSTEDYITQLSFQFIKALYDNKILTYNPELQRKPKEKVDKEGAVSYSPKVSAKGVKEITQLMNEGKFRSNTIVFNLLIDGTDEINYDEDENTLEIVSGKLNIIDGFHRLSAMLNVLEENPDYEGFMDVSIKHLSYDDARFYLGQINKMSKFDKTFVQYLMNNKPSDKIVNDLNRKSSLKDRITTDTTVSTRKIHITNFAVMSNAIEDNFELDKAIDRIRVTEALTNFFDILIGSYPEFTDNLEELKQYKKNSLMVHKNTFVGYIVIARKLFDKYGADIPSKEVTRIVDSFDFSIDGEYSKVLYREGSGKVNSNQVKREIKKYFEEKVDAILK